MASFQHDDKWQEAKLAVGGGNWLEVVDYYRTIGGISVFVYAAIRGSMYLVVQILDNDDILLLSPEGEWVVESYETVNVSRKAFRCDLDTPLTTKYYKDQAHVIPAKTTD